MIIYTSGTSGEVTRRGRALTDSAHFLLLRNRDHPVKAGAGLDGGFVPVWIRIGEVLFYSFFFFFSVTAQEKGKSCLRWLGCRQDGGGSPGALALFLVLSLNGIQSVEV